VSHLFDTLDDLFDALRAEQDEARAVLYGEPDTVDAEALNHARMLCEINPVFVERSLRESVEHGLCSQAYADTVRATFECMRALKDWVIGFPG